MDKLQALLDMKGLAAYLSLSVSTLKSFRRRGLMPRPIRLGRRVLWRITEIDAWVEAQCPMTSRKDISDDNEVQGINDRESATLIGVSRSTFLKLVAQGKAPPGIHLGRRHIWIKDEIRAWVNAGAPAMDKWQWPPLIDHVANSAACATAM